MRPELEGNSFTKVVRPDRVHIDRWLKQLFQELCRFIRDANDFVGRLTVQLEIELCLWSAVVPIGETFELASPELSLRDCCASDGDAHPRRLPGYPGLFCDRFGRGDHAAGDKTRAALILAGEHKDCVAFGDVFAAIHCLLRVKRKCLNERVGNLSFDYKCDTRRFVRAKSSIQHRCRFDLDQKFRIGQGRNADPCTCRRIF